LPVVNIFTKKQLEKLIFGFIPNNLHNIKKFLLFLSSLLLQTKKLLQKVEPAVVL